MLYINRLQKRFKKYIKNFILQKSDHEKKVATILDKNPWHT